MNHRPRRNRKSAGIRNMVQETRVNLDQLIFPLFMADGKDIRHEVKSMPGMFRLSQGLLLKEMEECLELGIKSFALFPSFDESQKDSHATLSYDAENYYLKFIEQAKSHFPEAVLMSDVAMDPYSSDGHDGIVVDGEIVNDPTLDVLSKMAVAQAQAGIDIIGPSDMMDGRVGHIREELDLNGYTDVSIMSYTAKYASGFYGPFRDALDSAPKAGDKKTYQMDPSNRREALREAALDLAEGADMLMVKPALSYLDIISDLQDFSNVPIAAYNVSGEYAMIKAAAANGWLDYDTVMPEVLTSIVRAGADIVLTYFAKDFAKMMR